MNRWSNKKLVNKEEEIDKDSRSWKRSPENLRFSLWPKWVPLGDFNQLLEILLFQAAFKVEKEILRFNHTGMILTVLWNKHIKLQLLLSMLDFFIIHCLVSLTHNLHNILVEVKYSINNHLNLHMLQIHRLLLFRMVELVLSVAELLDLSKMIKV